MNLLVTETTQINALYIDSLKFQKFLGKNLKNSNYLVISSYVSSIKTCFRKLSRNIPNNVRLVYNNNDDPNNFSLVPSLLSCSEQSLSPSIISRLIRDTFEAGNSSTKQHFLSVLSLRLFIDYLTYRYILCSIANQRAAAIVQWK